ncbi:MAG: hypothetical protein ACJ788_27200 [Ktedonobacteraceae bacterium]|jgi:hypothetical protein
MAANRDSHATIVSTSQHFSDSPWEQGDGAQYFSANPALKDNGDMTLVLIPLLSIYQQDNNHITSRDTSKLQKL